MTLDWRTQRTEVARAVEGHIRWLLKVKESPDQHVEEIEKARTHPKFAEIADLSEKGVPDLGGEGSSCFGREYGPVPRTIIDGTGNTAVNPDYDPSDDYCGTNCWMGLWKPDLADGEEQGSQGCLLLLLFTSVFGLPLPVVENATETNSIRFSILQLIPPFLDSLKEEKTMLNPDGSYIMEEGDQLVDNPTDGKKYVFSAAQKAYVQKPNGGYVTEDDLVQAPQAQPTPPPVPVAAPSQPTPVPAAAPSQPTTPVPPQAATSLPPQPQAKPQGMPAGTPAIPQAAPPAAPQQAAPAQQAPPVPQQAVPSADKAPSSVAVAPNMSDPKVDVQAALKKLAQVSSLIIEIRKDLGLGNAQNPPAPLSQQSEAPVEKPKQKRQSKPKSDTPTKEVQLHQFTTQPENVDLFNKFYAAVQNKCEGYTRELFKADFFKPASDTDLKAMCELIGVDWTSWKPETIKRTATARIIKSIF